MVATVIVLCLICLVCSMAFVLVRTGAGNGEPAALPLHVRRRR